MAFPSRTADSELLEQRDRSISQELPLPGFGGPLRMPYQLKRAVFDLRNPVAFRLDSPRDPYLAGYRLPIARAHQRKSSNLFEHFPWTVEDQAREVGANLSGRHPLISQQFLISVERVDGLILRPGAAT